jgi:hypothetical protein
VIGVIGGVYKLTGLSKIKMEERGGTASSEKAVIEQSASDFVDPWNLISEFTFIAGSVLKRHHRFDFDRKKYQSLNP